MHIKTDWDTFVVPVSVTVLAGALFVTPTPLNFGVLSVGSYRVISIGLLNGYHEPVRVEEAVVVGEPDPDFAIQFEGVRSARCCACVASAQRSHSARGSRLC